MRFNLLEMNLSTREKKVHDVTEDIRKYLGGRGYGAKLLWDRVPQGADPLGEENILYGEAKKLYLSYDLEPNGIPPKETLKRIGMEFVIPMLEKMPGN